MEECMLWLDESYLIIQAAQFRIQKTQLIRVDFKIVYSAVMVVQGGRGGDSKDFWYLDFKILFNHL